MPSLAEYYEPTVSIQETIKALSDPSLSHETHRGDVNKLIINLVIHYLAEYLEQPREDIERIKVAVRQAVRRTADDMERILIDMIARQSGISSCRSGTAQHLLALESLVDLRATSAIVKEIIFGGRFEVDQNGPFPDFFVSLDLGIGTGILSLAALIAAKRKEIKKNREWQMGHRCDGRRDRGLNRIWRYRPLSPSLLQCHEHASRT